MAEVAGLSNAVALFDLSNRIVSNINDLRRPSELCLVKLHAGEPDDTIQLSKLSKEFYPTLLGREDDLLSELSPYLNQGRHRDQTAGSPTTALDELLEAKLYSDMRQQSQLKRPANDSPNSAWKRYEALSYVWGKPDNHSFVRIRSNESLLKKQVYPSLKEALKAVRSTDRDRVFWIDFFCVDQDDEVAKAKQIEQFSEIFYQASRVCIWLGPASDDSDMAMDFIPQILNFEDFQDLVSSPAYHRQWLALNKLMARNWFQRRWIVQEMALAHDAVVQCGSKTCSWGDFTDALALAQPRWSLIWQIISGNAADKIGEVQPPGALSLVTISTNVFRKDSEGNIVGRRYDLEDLLAMLATFETIDPLDTVYSVMALAKDFDTVKHLEKSYKTPYGKFFASVIRAIAANSGNLDIICRPWAPNWTDYSGGIGQRRSWLRDVRDYPFTRRPDGQWDRENADCLVQDPKKRRYHADNFGKGFIKSGEVHNYSLSIRFLTLERIAHDGGLANSGIPEKWQSMAGWNRRKGPVPVPFWRTLVADRTKDGDNAPNWYARACEHSFRLTTTGAVNITMLLNSYKTSADLQEFLFRVQAVTSNRKMFKLDRLKTIGIGPPALEVGDLVCIIAGCSVPVVLRRHKESSGSLEYSLVGPCFVYGYMDGEVKNGDFDFKELDLERTLV